MYNSRSFIAVGLSVSINLAILYGITNRSHQLWQRDNSTLSVGEDIKSLLENMTLSHKSSVKHDEPQKPTRPEEKKMVTKKPIRKVVKTIQPDLTKSKEVPAKKEEDTVSKKDSAANSNSGVARPEIAEKTKLSSTPPPLVYPSSAIEKTMHGKVTLSAIIDAQGEIGRIRVMVSSGYEILDNAAIEWFQKLRFRPGNDGKVAVSSTVTQVINFSLRDAQHDA